GRSRLSPISAPEPTVAQLSTMVPASTSAPTFTKLGISTTFGAIYAERRTIDPGTARNPASRKRFDDHPANLDGTLSHHRAAPRCGSLGPPGISTISLSRNDSSTAFLSHWWTSHPRLVFSAT